MFNNKNSNYYWLNAAEEIKCLRKNTRKMWGFSCVPSLYMICFMQNHQL